MLSRLQQLRKQFASLNIDAFLVTFQPHLRYMSGFSGSSGIGLITSDRAALITDGRYASQVYDEVKAWKIFITQGSLFEELGKRKLVSNGMRIGFDGNTLIYTQFQQLKKYYPKVKFLPKAETIEKNSVIKDESEIRTIQRAVAITDDVFDEMLSLIKPGVTELDLAAEISYRQKKHGAEGDAFESIVASGERSALPHGRASAKKIQKGDLLTLDFGCIVDGYHSDMTRTVVIGRPKSEAKKIYSVVRDAQERAIESVRAGMKAKNLDAVARTMIRGQGFDKFYRHSLGHGIGLQIHEPPRISVLSTTVLETNMVITIEPGIYIPHLGGVRIEDDIVVRNGRCEVLNRSTKDFLVL